MSTACRCERQVDRRKSPGLPVALVFTLSKAIYFFIIRFWDSKLAVLSLKRTTTGSKRCATRQCSIGMQVASGCSVFGRADARIVVAAPAPCLPGRNSALLWRSCVRRAQTRARAASEPDRAPSGGGAGAGTVTSNSSPTGNPAVALPPGSNPLELLRVTRDVRTRAALMGEVMRDGNMSRYSAVYDPSPAEAVLAQELGQWPYNVMLFAVANPSLAALDVAKQLRPSLLSLRAAGLDQGDAWFLVTKRLELLANPLPLQRWLDLLSAHGLGSRELSNFLLRMPESLLCDTTQAQALQVSALSLLHLQLQLPICLSVCLSMLYMCLHVFWKACVSSCLVVPQHPPTRHCLLCCR